MGDFATACAQTLPERVRDALYARGVTDEQIALFGLGYVNRTLPPGDYPESFIQWSNIGDRMEDAIVLPLTNVLGEVRGLQFRHVARDRAGYMDFIEVNDEAILFGLGQAAPHLWAERSVVLVEGGFDLFPVQRVFPGTVATLTARVTDSLLRLLRRLVSRVWLGYDMDEPGRRACERYQKQLSSEFDAKVVLYPRVPMLGTSKLTKDPGDLWETWGDAKFQDEMRALLGFKKETSNA
jgi:DNA primase